MHTFMHIQPQVSKGPPGKLPPLQMVSPTIYFETKTVLQPVEFKFGDVICKHKTTKQAMGNTVRA